MEGESSDFVESNLTHIGELVVVTECGIDSQMVGEECPGFCGIGRGVIDRITDGTVALQACLRAEKEHVPESVL